MQEAKKLIFISGTGRSGTHLIGRTIATHKNIVGRIETPNTFGLVTQIATKQDISNSLYIGILKKYLRHQFNKILKKSESHILEKSHPSLWLTDYLIEEFETAKFIFVYRNVEPVVNSMLQHQGVLSWYKVLPQNKANRFLGINETNKNTFSKLSLAEKCTLRWLSHYEEIFRLKKKYPNKIYVLKYDDFLVNSTKYLKEISEFLNLEFEFSPEQFKINSLDKWQHELTEKQIANIRNLVKTNQS